VFGAPPVRRMPPALVSPPAADAPPVLVGVPPPLAATPPAADSPPVPFTLPPKLALPPTPGAVFELSWQPMRSVRNSANTVQNRKILGHFMGGFFPWHLERSVSHNPDGLEPIKRSQFSDNRPRTQAPPKRARQLEALPRNDSNSAADNDAPRISTIHGAPGSEGCASTDSN